MVSCSASNKPLYTILLVRNLVPTESLVRECLKSAADEEGYDTTICRSLEHCRSLALPPPRSLPAYVFHLQGSAFPLLIMLKVLPTRALVFLPGLIRFFLFVEVELTKSTFGRNTRIMTTPPDTCILPRRLSQPR